MNVKNEIELLAYVDNAFDFQFAGPLDNFRGLPTFTENDVNFTLSHPKFQQLLGEKFDAILIEIFESDALYGKKKKICDF